MDSPRCPLRRCLELFVRHREEVIRRRSEYQLQRARDRDHIVQGLLLALDRIDEVIEIIRNSADVEESRNNLVQQLDLSEAQAQAILDMQLRALRHSSAKGCRLNTKNCFRRLRNLRNS